MGFLVSPGVEINEVDLTNVIPAVSTSIGAYAGQFRKGPILQPTLISSEKELASIFGAPTTRNAADAVSFMTAAAFLKYGNALYVTRCETTGALNATSTSGTGELFTDSQGAEFDATTETNSIVAKDAGALGNSLRVEFEHKYRPFSSNTTDTGATYTSLFDSRPGTSDWASTRGISNDEVNVIVVDEDGEITGTPKTVLERFAGLSVISDAKKDNKSNFASTVINEKSQYIRVSDLAFEGVFDIEGATDAVNSDSDAYGRTAAEILSDGSNSDSDADGLEISLDSADADYSDLQVSLTGGSDGSTGTIATTGQIIAALDKYENAEEIDVSLVFAQNLAASGNNKTVADRIQTICEGRKDCIGFLSPHTDVTTPEAVKTYFDLINSSSYLVFDSTPVYVYNKYADEYLYIGASGHIAGLCARTDDTNDPWFSPAGYNRGGLLGVTKLKINPNQTKRDLLYKARINPIVSIPGQGILLFGDKTGQSKPSAFDRINVRRLFIVLEKAIATAAKYQLFELNDEFTRAMFRNMTEPFLRDVKGRRGITDFLVVCDETNNTGEVIDTNRFVADIFIKPARSINFITLNFIATRTDVEFTEIAGGQG